MQLFVLALLIFTVKTGHFYELDLVTDQVSGKGIESKAQSEEESTFHSVFISHRLSRVDFGRGHPPYRGRKEGG